MVYTSYYGKVKNISEDIKRISIALHPPSGIAYYIHGDCSILFPNKETLSKYKYNTVFNKKFTEIDYEKEYRKKLNKINAENLIDYLYKKYDTKDIVFVCYEKSGDFCHRNILRAWLNENGIPCEEWNE